MKLWLVEVHKFGPEKMANITIYQNASISAEKSANI